MPKIGIFGGNGFLGRAISEVGLQRGYEVTAFSRSGHVPANISAEPWSQKVIWERANIFDPSTYVTKLKNFDVIVHSIGILFEGNGYKDVLKSKNGLNLEAIKKLVKGGNPMERTYETTYEAIQRDSAIQLARTFNKEKKNGKQFVYISADQQIPFIPKGYLTTKREAEEQLLALRGLKSIILRPGFMYEEKDSSQGKDLRDVLSTFIGLGYATKNATIGNNIPLFNSFIRPTVSTKRVAEMIFDKLKHKDFKGIVTLDEINRA